MDVTVFSTASEVLKTACAGIAPASAGCWILPGICRKTIDVVFDTNHGGAHRPHSRLCRHPGDRSLYQARAVTVWVQASEDEMDAAILAGADGIVTDDWTAVLGAIEAYARRAGPHPAHRHRGHRGFP